MYKKIQRNGYEFFNCNENRDSFSMNPLYETKMYRNTRHSRRLLWYRIKEELKKKTIVIAKENLTNVRKAIMNMAGSPVDANQYIKFGIILEKQMED